MSQFAFLQAEWPAVFEAAAKAEAAVHPDPRTACFYARRALELLVHWVFKHVAGMELPYQDNLSALIHEPTFKNAAGEAVFNKGRLIAKLGNAAVHNHRPVQLADAQTAMRELFHVGYWLARTYAKGAKPASGLIFLVHAIPVNTTVTKQTIDQLGKLETQLRERDEKLSALLADKTALDAELSRLRAEIAEARKANAAQLDSHDYSEEETRDYFIDLLLKEANWPLDQKRDREFEVEGMPNKQGRGKVDYVLWGDDGLPLALIEAKRTRRDPRIGQQQAKLYADCLEKRFGRRPVIFYSNGYDHWMWDDANYPPRSVQGFYKKSELELLIQRRTSQKPLASARINELIVERYYQSRAIRKTCETFEIDKQRKALLVMATGAGKTRTVIALVELLMQCNWVKRALFLADRIALVNQAANAFKKHLPSAPPVNLIGEREAEGRIFVSTYPTMMGLIEDARDGQRRFGVGHFDLVVIDEAHCSVFQKYKAIFDYFDSLLVGLTATPKGEVHKNTYSLFELETGVPTDAYPLEEAVADKFLVPPLSVSVPLKFQRQGIDYDKLSDEEKEQLMGRGTRLCPDLFGPGKDKKLFYVFDYCGNLEFFKANAETTDGSEGESLGKQLFKTRLELVGVLDSRGTKADSLVSATSETVLRSETAETLRVEVAAMNPENFVVRPKRRLVEIFSEPMAWQELTQDNHRELAEEVAGLPSELKPESEEAKRFDLLVLRLQLAVLLAEPRFERLRDQVMEIAGLLEEKESIPRVKEQMPLIQDLQTEEWWADVTAPMLENVREKLRDPVQLIEKARRKPIYTDIS